MLRSHQAELSDSFRRIGQHTLDVTIRPLDPSSRTAIDASLAAVLTQMPNIQTLTIICDPLDTRKHTLVTDVFRHFRALEHISLSDISLCDPPRRNWPRGWPIRLGLQEPARQLDAEVEAMESSESGPETDTSTDTDTETQTGTAGPVGVTRNYHSFRKKCLEALLQHHAPRLVSVRLHGSVPLDEHNYRRLRDNALKLCTLHLVGGLEACEQGLAAVLAEDARWASGTLCDLIIRGTSPNTRLEALMMRQFSLRVYGDALDEPPSVSSGYPSHGTRRA